MLPSALWALRTVKNSTTNHSSFELVYGREDQQPFDIAARPTKGINKSSDEILLEKFINHYRWTMEACENIKNVNKYWAARREEKQSWNKTKEIKAGDILSFLCLWQISRIEINKLTHFFFSTKSKLLWPNKIIFKSIFRNSFGDYFRNEFYTIVNQIDYLLFLGIDLILALWNKWNFMI